MSRMFQKATLKHRQVDGFWWKKILYWLSASWCLIIYSSWSWFATASTARRSSGSCFSPHLLWRRLSWKKCELTIDIDGFQYNSKFIGSAIWSNWFIVQVQTNVLYRVEQTFFVSSRVQEDTLTDVLVEEMRTIILRNHAGYHNYTHPRRRNMMHELYTKTQQH